MEAHLLEQQLRQSSFNAHTQKFTLGNIIVWPLSCGRPQEMIIARQQNLDEIMIIQLLVIVQIKVLNHLCEIVRLQFPEAILACKHTKLIFVQHALIKSIKPLKSCIRLKFSQTTQNLPELLYLYLLFSCEH